MPLFRSLLNATGGSFTNGSDAMSRSLAPGHPPNRRMVASVAAALNSSF
jgi:hypothetical protein